MADWFFGEGRAGGWWGRPGATEFYNLTPSIRAHGDIGVCRFLGGKITYTHRDCWPVLRTICKELPPGRLDKVVEVHTQSGHHEVFQIAASEWLLKAGDSGQPRRGRKRR